MDSEEERNQTGNSYAGLSDLQMRAFNDSMANLMNAGLEQIHLRLDEIQNSQPARSRTRRDRPRRKTGQMKKSERRRTKTIDPSTVLGEVPKTVIKVMSILLL